MEPAMDVNGITYIIENAQQFWSELDDMLRFPSDATLDQLDAALRMFISFCARYHEQYLQSPLQLDHACDILLNSELFTFHSERMCDLLLHDAQTDTDPHCQLIIYNVLLAWGRRHAKFLRSHKRWSPIVPLLIDHVRLDLDLDAGDAYLGISSMGGSSRGLSVPIETKLRLLSVQLLYQVCRVQTLSLKDLEIFDDTFIEFLFELVEQTRDQHDETFNYAVIKLIVALNEQFMVASLPPSSSTGHSRTNSAGAETKPEEQNRVLRVLMARIASSATFGENLIFMLNRAGRTAEDLVMQLLVLKILYLLFTTKGCAEYFYTNDLCVLVDVFLREILNLDEEHESLRHTYLRVLYPLLTKTQLRTMPYKRAQIVHVLESLIEHENIRDVNPTTKRLVQRCLSGDWCVQFRKKNKTTSLDAQSVSSTDSLRSPGVESLSSVNSPMAVHASASNTLLAVVDSASSKSKSLKTSRSADNLRTSPQQGTSSIAMKEREREAVRIGTNDSSLSLPRVTAATTVTPSLSRRRDKDRAGSLSEDAPSTSQSMPLPVIDPGSPLTQEPPEIVIASPFSPPDTAPIERLRPDSPTSVSSLTSASSLPSASSLHTASSAPNSPGPRTRRAPPAPPQRRRKPPAIPVRTNSGGVTIETIASSTSTPASPRLHSPLVPRSGVASR